MQLENESQNEITQDAPTQELSLRDQLEAAWNAKDVQPAEQTEEGRARDDKGRFAAKQADGDCKFFCVTGG